MTPFYQDPAATLYHADCLAALLELPDDSVDCLITDPPYSSGGMVRGDRMQDVHTKYVQSDSIQSRKLAAFSGDNRDQRSFGYWTALWLGESRRVVRDGGVAALFVDWRQLPMVTDALQAGGYVWRGIVPWHKPSARPTQGRWANSCEYVVWGTNGPRELTGSAFPGFYSANPPRERDHITEKPVEVLADMLKVVPAGGTVLDPFAGSGTTLVAAKSLGLRSIGVEIEEGHCATVVRRLSQASLFAPQTISAQEQLALGNE